MVLLPDIEFIIDGERYLLSIQEPFTLNGYLVTDIDMLAWEMSYQSVSSGTIRIKNENNYYVELGLEEFQYRFKREINHFINRHGFHACVVDRPDISDWSSYSFDKYIYEIQHQCNKIRDYQYNRYSNNYSNNYYLNALKADLRRQGRENVEPARRTLNYSYSFHNPYGISVSDASAAIADIRNFSLGLWDSSSSSNSNNNSDSIRKYIHDYNYKPEYIHHYMADEDSATALLLGCEIEVAGNEKELNRDDVVKKCIQIMNGSKDDTENLIYSTSDSTVQIELDTMPCSLEFHKNKMNYKELFEYLDKLGYKGHDCDKAGLHIHANRSYLGKSELVQQLTISKILYIIEKFNDEICVIARRNNDYSKFVGKEEVNKSLDKLYGKYKDTGKKVALNLQHKETIEFRMFRSTLKYETFILTLEFVKNIIDYAKSINIEEIELIKWSDLMNTFSDELKKYYNERLEKENKKKGTEKLEKKECNPYDVTTWSNGTICTSGLRGLRASCITWDEDVTTTLTGFNPASTLRDLVGEWDIQMNENTSSKTAEEKLKDKIKSLKKQIKNSNNFMEKKNLEKELNEAQKELKKEKKKKKLINNTNATT